jgi:hypothetical protein
MIGLGFQAALTEVAVNKQQDFCIYGSIPVPRAMPSSLGAKKPRNYLTEQRVDGEFTEHRKGAR